MQYGIARGMYSNEAGEGTAPFAHGCSNLYRIPSMKELRGLLKSFLIPLSFAALRLL